MVSGDIKPDVVYENSQVLAFRDLAPQAPTHVLVIPKKHISTLNDLTSDDVNVMGEMALAAKKVAELEGIDAAGFRSVMNCNQDGGQSVYHIHMHVLGGRAMQWPPG